ncbi:uncharacterized protein LOC122397412 [Colletes gigas]|uniref:uncharacterized protein LOC122397412 n=1 Tax=Colletes gigas TaxID=935657 RepID=UPI001C9AB5F0|nr:uncharacterized protein LOC122397412 [Colletes gigas]
MTARPSAKRTGLCLLTLLLSCFYSGNVLVAGEPEPIPSELLDTDDSFNTDNYILWNRLKHVIQARKDTFERGKELEEEQMIIQSALETRAKVKSRLPPGDYSAEELPTPNAMVSQPRRSEKRTTLNYAVTLCHFKICNMGRKRQLHK